jgi:7,8-dihydropterin-6-yl-methyl-4-(beta-D-ribofuranosyl)aminobenzene 5'-phosphate synthase
MKVYTLLENESQQKGLKSAHGLSLYIEFNGAKILFDVGPGKQFIKNAEKLGIDLAQVDYLVLSHGHFDHGTRINRFLEINSKATVYLSSHAFEGHYKKIGKIHIPIGIPSIKQEERVIFVDNNIEIIKGLKLYTEVNSIPQIIGDQSLEKKIDGEYLIDDFNHEIYMVLEENTNTVLFSGCSHKGIENIIDTLEQLNQKPFTAVVGGFHFSHYDEQNKDQTTYLKDLSNKLKNKDSVQYYTGHCTGAKAYAVMEQVLTKQLKRVKSGVIFEV